MLYTLNLCSAVCQLYLHKTARKKKKKQQSLLTQGLKEGPKSHDTKE